MAPEVVRQWYRSTRPNYDRWWRSAESSLLMARLGAEHEQHHHACLHAEQAARQAVKGLLFAVGAGGRARGHNLSL
jgi:HEPN domain-containing protein